MYQPLIKFHPHPAIFTQVLTIFAEYRMQLGITIKQVYCSALAFHYICLKKIIYKRYE